MGILGHAASHFMSLYHIHYVYAVPGVLHYSEGSGKQSSPSPMPVLPSVATVATDAFREN